MAALLVLLFGNDVATENFYFSLKEVARASTFMPDMPTDFWTS